MDASSPLATRRPFAPIQACAKLTSAKVRSMADMSDSLLELRDVEASYGLSRVLFGVSLTVGRGEMVSLLGRNGMGKTTTVRSIIGLTPAAASSIRFGGDNIRWLPAYPSPKR